MRQLPSEGCFPEPVALSPPPPSPATESFRFCLKSCPSDHVCMALMDTVVAASNGGVSKVPRVSMYDVRKYEIGRQFPPGHAVVEVSEAEGNEWGDCPPSFATHASRCHCCVPLVIYFFRWHLYLWGVSYLCLYIRYLPIYLPLAL